jgi:lipase chaperone LimK
MTVHTHPPDPARRVVKLALLVALLAAAGFVWLAWDGAGGSEAGIASRDALIAQPPAAGNVATATAASAPALVEIDVLGARLDASRLFQLGFGGGLTMDPQTRDALDTLLVHSADPMSEADARKLEHTLRQGLPPEEAERALKLFHGYREYLSDVREHADTQGIPQTPEAVDAYFTQLALTQRRHFDDATAEALFGRENRQARLVLLASLVEQDSHLDMKQKEAQLEALRAQLPPQARDLIPPSVGGSAPEPK